MVSYSWIYDSVIFDNYNETTAYMNVTSISETFTI